MSVLKIAIQKSGRLSDNSKKLLEECGIKFSNGAGVLKTIAQNFPVEVLGENMVFEKDKNVSVIEKLGFAYCRLSMAIPKEETYTGPGYFMNKKVATSYPKILTDFLRKNNITSEIEEISGSVEIAPGIGLADGICDIVSSGSTLLTNGLKEVETIMKSQAVIIGNNNLSREKQEILDNLLFRIRAVKNAKENKYILLNAPESAVQKICDILPGMKSPTIVPLVEKGWCSLHSVVKEDQFWERINQLKEAGAEGILVIPIEKMIM